MSKVLCALATTRHASVLGQQAVAEAKAKNAGLVLLLVTETEELHRVYQLRSDPMLLGTRALEDLLSEIEEEHRRILAEEAAEIDRLAARMGVPVERIEASGRYEHAVAQSVAAGSYEVVFWLRHSRGFIARFFLGSDEDEVVRVETRR
jgi:hypothetical protein